MPELIDETCVAFLERVRGMMVSWAIAAGAHPQDAGDIVQEAMVEAVRNGKLFMRLSDAKRAGWLKRTVHGKVIDAQRYRSRGKRAEGRTRSLNDLAAGEVRERVRSKRLASEPLADGTTPSGAAVLSELRAQVLSEIPQVERQVCTLLLVEKRTPVEIAAKLGIAIEEVEVKLVRGLPLLKSAIERLME